MKSKRLLCTVLACVVMISCITNVAAIQEEVADDFVEYNTESILTTRAIGEFEMTVSAKTKAIADKENIKLDDETYKTELKKIADAYGYDSVKALKKAASKSELKEIALNDLVKEWLANQCIQVEASSSSSSSSSDSSSSSSSDSGN